MPARKKLTTPKKTVAVKKEIDGDMKILVSRAREEDREAPQKEILEEAAAEKRSGQVRKFVDLTIHIEYWNNGEIQRPIEYEDTFRASDAFSKETGVGKAASVEEMTEILADRTKRHLTQVLEASIGKDQ